MSQFPAGIPGHFQVDFINGLEKPKFEEKDEVFKVTLFGPGDDILDLIPEKEAEDLRKTGLNERQIKALRDMVNRKQKITNKEYRERFDVSKATAYRDLKYLVEGFIESKGEGRSQYYLAQ